MRTILAALTLTLLLVACQPAPPPVDITPINNRLDALTGHLEVLVASVDVLDARVTRLDDNTREDLGELNDAAQELAALIQQPFDLSRVDITSLDLVGITTLSGSVDFLTFEPGECPDDAPAGRPRVPATEALSGILMPAPSGPHCLTIGETDQYEAAAITLTPLEGGITTINLFPFPKTE